MILEHGERYGKLTVLTKIKTARGTKYRCGCTCGFSGVLLRAAQLMKGSVMDEKGFAVECEGMCGV